MESINRGFRLFDHVVLLLVSIGILYVTFLLLWDIGLDFFEHENHTIPHYISELMFVLIAMELFRQTIRQLNSEPFSLNPLIFIGVIASVRGILITQMKLTTHEIDFKEGVTVLVVYALIVLILIFCYYLISKVTKSEKLFLNNKGKGP